MDEQLAECHRQNQRVQLELQSTQSGDEPTIPHSLLSIKQESKEPLTSPHLHSISIDLAAIQPDSPTKQITEGRPHTTSNDDDVIAYKNLDEDEQYIPLPNALISITNKNNENPQDIPQTPAPTMQPLRNGEQSIRCYSCNQRLTTRAGLQKHVKRKHTGKRPYICKICHHAFTDKYYLKTHEERHAEKKLLICEHCNKTFITASCLQRHIKTHTEGKRDFECTYCNKKFNRRDYFESHIRTHTGEKPFNCKFCNSAFVGACHLINHEKIHTGSKSFECIICNKKFSTRAKLLRHGQTHTGEKPHVCKICDRAFAEKSNLTHHEKTHSGEKKFECDYCNKKFTTRSIIIRHIRTHFQ